MTMSSRRDVLRSAVGTCLLALTGAGVARAQTGGRPTITVYKDPT